MSMEDVLKADIFFFITAVAVVILSVLGVIIGVYLVRILREVEYIARVAHREVDQVAEDIEDISEDIKDDVSTVHQGISYGIGGIISLLLETIGGARKRRSRKKTKKRL